MRVKKEKEEEENDRKMVNGKMRDDFERKIEGDNNKQKKFNIKQRYLAQKRIRKKNNDTLMILPMTTEKRTD